MWGDYGAYYKLSDNEYLAEISTHSRDLAERVVANELNRRYDVRIWVFEILQHAAWATHGAGCQCPIEGLDPEVQVWACAETLQMLLAEECDRRDVDLPTLMQQTSDEGFDTRSWAETVITSSELVRQAHRAALEYATGKEARKSRT